jgi:hypothetical protein
MIPYSQTKIQTIQGKWSVQKVSVENFRGLWAAKVRYECKDNNGNSVDSFVINYTADKYNDWFENFNTGTFLLEELKKEKQLTEEIEADSEGNFFNPSGSTGSIFGRRIIS